MWNIDSGKSLWSKVFTGGYSEKRMFLMGFVIIPSLFLNCGKPLRGELQIKLVKYNLSAKVHTRIGMNEKREAYSS